VYEVNPVTIYLISYVVKLDVNMLRSIILN